MKQLVEIKKVYAAGIVNSKDQWTWQGTVVANTIAEAKKLLVSFRIDFGISGHCEVVDMNGPNYTNRPIGVSESTDLF
jgi:hypothetical protein